MYEFVYMPKNTILQNCQSVIFLSNVLFAKNKKTLVWITVSEPLIKFVLLFYIHALHFIKYAHTQIHTHQLSLELSVNGF